MTYIYDEKRGASVPFLVVQREIIADESNKRIIMQRRGLADSLRIQHLCTRFGRLVVQTIKNSEAIAHDNWFKVTTPSLVALQTKHREEILELETEVRLQLQLFESENKFELFCRIMNWNGNVVVAKSSNGKKEQEKKRLKQQQQEGRGRRNYELQPDFKLRWRMDFFTNLRNIFETWAGLNFRRFEAPFWRNNNNINNGNEKTRRTNSRRMILTSSNSSSFSSSSSSITSQEALLSSPVYCFTQRLTMGLMNNMNFNVIPHSTSSNPQTTSKKSNNNDKTNNNASPSSPSPSQRRKSPNNNTNNNNSLTASSSFASLSPTTASGKNNNLNASSPNSESGKMFASSSSSSSFSPSLSSSVSLPPPPPFDFVTSATNLLEFESYSSCHSSATIPTTTTSSSSSLLSPVKNFKQYRRFYQQQRKLRFERGVRLFQKKKQTTSNISTSDSLSAKKNSTTNLSNNPSTTSTSNSSTIITPPPSQLFYPTPERNIAISLCYLTGTLRRLRHSQILHHKLSSQQMFYLRCIFPKQETAALLLQRIGRGSCLGRDILRKPMMNILRNRAGKIILKALKKYLEIVNARRVASRLAMTKNWQRSLARSVDNGMVLKASINILQQFVRFRAAIALRACLHVVSRIEADAVRRRFFVNSVSILRSKIRRKKSVAKSQQVEFVELQNYSALKIQTWFRKVFTIMKVHCCELFHRQQNQLLREQLELENYYALEIQSRWRKYVANRAASSLRRVLEMRRKMKIFVQERNYFALLIQKNWKRFVAVRFFLYETTRQRQEQERQKQERLDRLNKPFEESTCGANPFQQKVVLANKNKNLMSSSSSEIQSEEDKFLVDDKTLAGSAASAFLKKKAGCSRDPVVPSSFAYFQKLPYAMSSSSTQKLTPEQEKQLKLQRQLRLRRVAIHQQQTKEAAQKIISNPTEFTKKTRNLVFMSNENHHSFLAPTYSSSSSSSQNQTNENTNNTFWMNNNNNNEIPMPQADAVSSRRNRVVAAAIENALNSPSRGGRSRSSINGDANNRNNNRRNSYSYPSTTSVSSISTSTTTTKNNMNRTRSSSCLPLYVGLSGTSFDRQQQLLLEEEEENMQLEEEEFSEILEEETSFAE